MKFVEISDKIKEIIAKELPKIKVLDSYARFSLEEYKQPVIVFELSEFEGNKEMPATGQLDINTKWSARVFVPTNIDSRAALIVREIVFKLTTIVHENTFDLVASMPARFLRAQDEGLDDEIKTYETWLVEWEQILRIGKDYSLEIPDFIPKTMKIEMALHE